MVSAVCTCHRNMDRIGFMTRDVNMVDIVMCDTAWTWDDIDWRSSLELLPLVEPLPAFASAGNLAVPCCTTASSEKH